MRGKFSAPLFDAVAATVPDRDFTNSAALLGEAESQADGLEVMIAGFVFMTLFWWFVFYLAAFTEEWWGQYIPKSTKDEENDKYWLVRHYLGSLMGILIACLTVPTIIHLWHEPSHIKFAHSSHLAFCELDGLDEHVKTWGIATAFAGMAFTTYTMADLANMFVLGFVTWDYLAHHIFFIAVGLIMRCNCILFYEAAILLAMEVSTPFLNYVLIYRNRGEAYATSLAVAGGLFFILFITTRIVLNTWGAYLLILHREEHLMTVIPPWQAWSLLSMIIAGILVQFFWLPPVLKAFGSHFLPLIRSVCCK